MPTRARWTALLLALATAAGCGIGDAGSDGPAGRSEEQELRVARDPDATAAQIVEAGTAVGVGTTGDRTLVTYRVSGGDGGESFRVAWRLYDGSGDRLAEGRLSNESSAAGVQTVGDAFVLPLARDLLRVDRDGRTLRLRLAASRREPTRPGDVLLSDALPPSERPGRYFIRPSDPRVHRLASLPGPQVQGAGIDATGRVWVHHARTRGRSQVSFSRDGRHPWDTEPFPGLRGTHPLPPITVIGRRLLVFTSPSGTAESAPLDALWERSTEPGGRWRRTDLSDLDLGRTLAPQAQALPDGRLVLSDDEEPFQVQEGRGFRAAEVPGRHTVDLTVAGGAIHVPRHPRHDLMVSRDEGRTWTPLRR